MIYSGPANRAAALSLRGNGWERSAPAMNVTISDDQRARRIASRMDALYGRQAGDNKPELERLRIRFNELTGHTR